MAALRGEGIPDAEARPLERLERDLQRISAVQVHEHPEAARTQRLDSGDEWGGRHESEPRFGDPRR